jgi:HEAT repeat protein
MSNADANQEPGNASSPLHCSQQREQILAAIILLLGSETGYRKRLQAAQFLADSGPTVLPLLLRMLHHSPAITMPIWPWWPPQYEQVGRLLLQLSQAARISLADLLQVPSLSQPPGPVLWTGVMEAIRLVPHAEYEPLVLAGLEAPWWTVRYAAATAVATRAGHLSPGQQVRQALSRRQHSDPETPVRLAASCALLRCADGSGLDMLIQFLEQPVPPEVRKAATFLLATELIAPPGAPLRHRLQRPLLQALQDSDPQVTLYAARALCSIADTGTLPALEPLLDHPCTHVRLATLTALEELAGRKTMRHAMQRRLLAQRIASFLHTPESEVRRQSCYTLATLGGEYAAAVLGTTVQDDLHPAHLEAIEALRLLPEVHCTPVLAQVTRWLLHALGRTGELARVCALDSLSYIVWQAHTRQRSLVLRTIGTELGHSGCVLHLLTCASARVRQRTVELLTRLGSAEEVPRATLLTMLHSDCDSGVRSSIARMLGQTGALWALPDLLAATQDCDEQVAEAVLGALGALPLFDDTLLICAFKELAAYHLPPGSLCTGHRQIHMARAWLKRRAQRVACRLERTQAPPTCS